VSPEEFEAEKQRRIKAPPAPAIDFGDLVEAIQEFKIAFPGWWWSICECAHSRDASCGPDINGPDLDLLETKDEIFGDGFHCDDQFGSLADALRDVTRQAVEARTKARAA
jgi:hypothetical protein